jgi:alpha-N-arabinofuranosidase
MDEWNYWHREYAYGELGCVYDLLDGLGVAAGLHEYFRNTDVIQMAHYAQTMNVIGAIKTTRIAAEFETTGLVLAMYRKHFEALPLTLELAASPLDLTAAVNEEGTRLTLGVVNPTASAVRLELDGGLPGRLSSAGYCVTGPEPTSYNTPGEPRRVDLTALTPESPGVWLIPALSACVLALQSS